VPSQFDVELERAIAVLVCVYLCSSHDAELLADEIESFDRVIQYFNDSFARYVIKFGAYRAKSEHIVDPLLNSEKVWRRLASLLRSSSRRIAFQAANLVGMLTQSTDLSHFEQAWTILVRAQPIGIEFYLLRSWSYNFHWFRLIHWL
jgi:hypothetical protein